MRPAPAIPRPRSGAHPAEPVPTVTTEEPAPLWPGFDGSDRPPREDQRRRALIRGIALATILVTTAYLVWRGATTLDGAALWLGVPLLLLEIHALVSLCLHTADLWDTDALPPPEPVQTTHHRIAVLVPTCNEPREVLLPTIAAAVALHPAHDTWVLDDGARPWVAELAAELGAHYTAREGNEHAKAGNVNALLGRLDVDLVAILDADHVAHARLLTHTLGYFDDPRIALVQTPQDFYNLDSFEHVDRPGRRRYAEQELFYRGVAAGRNRWNAAFWCGTNAVVRLAALRDVGGVATETVTEDIHTTIRLHRRGWRTAYHNEVLARGLAAANSEQYLNQRLRWGTGAMQVLRQENPAFVGGLRPMQRVSYLSTLLGWFESWRSLGYVLLPGLTVATGAVPLSAPVTVFLAWFGAVFLLQRLALVALSRGRAPQWHSTLFEFIRLPANLAATTALFSARARPFMVTAKGRDGSDRRRMPVPGLLVGLLVASGLVLAWYAATVAGRTVLTYDVAWVAHAAALWLLVNVVVLAMAARRIRDERFGADRRAAVRFDLGGTVLLDGTPGRLRDVSLTGLHVAAAPGTVSSGQRVRAGVTVGERLLELDAVVRAVRPRAGHDSVGLELVDVSATQSAALALALFRTGIAPQLVGAAER